MSSPFGKIKFNYAGIFIPLIFLISAVVSLFSLAHFNTLQNRNIWFSPEVDSEKTVSHGELFFKKRISLAEGQLDLGSWHGSNELISKKSFNVKKIRLRYKLTEDSYLVVGVQDRNNQFHGVRLSNFPLFPSISFKVDALGEFSDKASYAFTGDKDIWHEAEFDLSSAPFNLTDLNDLHLGLRNGARSAVVDWIKAFDADGQQVFRDGFYWQTDVVLISFLSSFLLLVLIHLIAGIYIKQKQAYLYSALFLFTFLIYAFLVWSVYFFYLSHQYEKIEANIAPPTLQSTDRWLKNMTTGNAPTSAKDYLTTNSVHFKKPIGRLLFYGSSQTWGEGARTEIETWVRVACSHLQKNISECINYGQKGAIAADIYKFIQKNSAAPGDLAIINLGNNDRSSEPFKDNLLRSIHHLKEEKANVMLILEANEPQVNSSHLEVNHALMQEICKAESIPCFYMHGYLLNPKLIDSGFMWWDHVHATSYTQRIMGETVSEVVKLLQQ